MNVKCLKRMLWRHRDVESQFSIEHQIVTQKSSLLIDHCKRVTFVTIIYNKTALNAIFKFGMSTFEPLFVTFSTKIKVFRWYVCLSWARCLKCSRSGKPWRLRPLVFRSTIYMYTLLGRLDFSEFSQSPSSVHKRVRTLEHLQKGLCVDFIKRLNTKKA